MTDSSVEAVARAIDPEAWQAFDEQANRRSWNAFERAEAMIAGKRLAKSLDAACRVLAALPSPEREPMREALANARAYVALGSIYARNLGEMEVVREAGEMLAEIDALLAPPTAQSGDRT